MRNRKIRWRRILYNNIVVGAIFFLFSCNVTKFLPEGEALYTGAEIKIEQEEKVRNKKRIRRILEERVTTKPNTKIFGARLGVWIYYKTGGTENSKGLKGWIRKKLAQQPVLLKDIDYERTSNVLQGTLFNYGYFEAYVRAGVKTNHKKSTIIYTATLAKPFSLRNIHYPEHSDSVYKLTAEKIKEGTLLKTGRRYNLERLQAEQARIAKVLTNFGFFYFDKRYFIFEADTTVGHHQVDVDLKLVPGIPQKARRMYRFDQVNIINDFSVANNPQPIADTIRVAGFNYIDNRKNFRPAIIADIINIKPGLIYTRDDHDYTLNHLMGLGNFQFVNIKYTDSNRDSALLNANIYLTPLLKKSIRLELQMVSKSNNFVGPGVGVTFTNRNLLRGAERFELKLNSAYEVQIGGQQAGPLNSFELGLQSSVSIPRFISPWSINYSNARFIPNTKIKFGYNLQQRINYFQITSFNLAFGYTWRESMSRSHELYPIDINYIRLNRTSVAFDELLENNKLLANSLKNQFIIGTRYNFTLNTQLNNQRSSTIGQEHTSTHDFYFSTNIALAGNAIHYVQGRFNESSGTYELFNAPYSQFVMGDIDFRHYLQINRNNKFVSRLAIGTGYAFGNSQTLPYINQFATGGSNSVRAFPARSIGPGTYNVRTDPKVKTGTYFIDQRGDIKLEANAEFRFDIVKSLKGALFVDAGNIWLMRDDPERIGGKFNKETFLKELAVGTGAGIRVDLNFFVIRFDLAIPIRKPYLPEDARWVFDQIDFGSKLWRRENLIFNIAIGYPF